MPQMRFFSSAQLSPNLEFCQGEGADFSVCVEFCPPLPQENPVSAPVQLKTKIGENQGLYRNKDDFRFLNKKFLYFDLKYFIFCK